MTPQRGNALFLILIAVALFAALSYAITQSGRGGGTISKEQAKIDAAMILQAEAEVRQGVQRMILNGTSEADILIGSGSNVAQNGWGSANGSNDFCTSGNTCLFASEGGGVAIPQLPQSAFDLASMHEEGFYVPHVFEDSTSFNGIVIDGMTASTANNAFPGAGTDANDSNFIVFNLKKEVCDEINRNLGITGDLENWPGGTHQAECLNHATYRAGTYLYYSVILPH